MNVFLESLSHLSDSKLLDHLDSLVARDRRTTADLLMAIAEIDERKLWANEACSSMFVFCVRRMHMSEQVTSKRLWAARTARRFPVIFDMVSRGELHLSAIQRLAPYLTPTNHVTLLEHAKHKSTREVEELIADLAPRPDAPSRVRALPKRREVGASRDRVRPMGPGHRQTSGGRAGADRVDGEGANGDRVQRGSSMASSGDGGGVEGSSRDRVAGSDRDGSGNAFENLCGPVPAAAARDAGTPFEPLGARRYRIEITVDEKTHDKLRSLQDLLARSASGTDPAVIVSRALDVLLTETLKRKAGCTKRPKAAATDGRASNEGCVSSAKRVSNEARAASDGRAANDGRVTKDRQATNAGRRARSIPAAVRRAVWRRDCGRCRYVDPRGRRCDGTRNVDFHHVVPFAMGGSHTVDNIELRCAAHNQYQADLDFGRAFMDARRRSSSAAGVFPAECRAASSAGRAFRGECRTAVAGPSPDS
jgi:5-methylcytosine-specific restriction endonuclease McrA